MTLLDPRARHQTRDPVAPAAPAPQPDAELAADMQAWTEGETHE